MKIKYTWSVPDMLTVTDPEKQGPTVATRDGMSNIVIGTNWALRGQAMNDDDTTMLDVQQQPIIDVISHYTPFGDPDPNNFIDVTALSFEDLTARLSEWLFKHVNKADQEQQLADRLKPRIAPPSVMKMPTQNNA